MVVVVVCSAEEFRIWTKVWLEIEAALYGVTALLTMALRSVSRYRDGGDSACGSHKADWLLIDVSRR